GEGEHAEVARETSLRRQGLRAQDLVNGREAYVRARVVREPARALERQHVRRIRHDLEAARCGERAILARRRQARARAERRDGGEEQRFELVRGGERERVEGVERAQVERRGSDERVAAVLLEQLA